MQEKKLFSVRCYLGTIQTSTFIPLVHRQWPQRQRQRRVDNCLQCRRAAYACLQIYIHLLCTYAMAVAGCCRLLLAFSAIGVRPHDRRDQLPVHTPCVCVCLLSGVLHCTLFLFCRSITKAKELPISAMQWQRRQTANRFECRRQRSRAQQT